MEKANNKSQNIRNSYDFIMNNQNKKNMNSKQFQTTFIKTSILNKKYSKDDIRNYNKRENHKNLSHIYLNKKRSFQVKSLKNLRTFSNINLHGLTLHDAIYLGTELNNNKNDGIRANDILCYLSNTSIYQPEETKYKLIEKNIQNKILDISMEITKKSLFDSKLSNNDSYTKKTKKPKKSMSSKKAIQINKKSSRLKTTLLKSLSIKSHETSAFIVLKEQQLDKIRKITKKKVLYDSLAEDESDENVEEDDSGLNPRSIFIDIFDCILLLTSLFSLFYIPYRLAKTKLNIQDDEYIVLIFIYFTEIIYIFDLIFGFFRWYYNNELKLVNNSNMILRNYLLGYFLIDLIQAIPFYTIYKFAYLNNEEDPPYDILFNEKHFTIKIFTCVKSLKIFKINDRKNNRFFHFLNMKVSNNYLSERIYQITNFALITMSVINIFICFHIYIGKLSYPNWIISSRLQDSSFIEIYLGSLYFIIATMTSVGYGDIVCINKEETYFQILLLSIGLVAYSWIISTVGDYVKNESRATIKYNKDVAQLEEIRIAYPNMPFKLYNKIHQHLQRLLKQQEKYDSNLLINSLPYSLKNSLLFEIHKDVITKFIFFNGCENSDFILKVLTHFIPLNSKKNAFLIKEGEIIENIFFVKDGRLSLEAAIDLDNIEESVEKYLEYQFEGISSIVESDDIISLTNEKLIKEENVKPEKKKKIKNYKDLYNIVSRQTELIGDLSYLHESHIEEEIGKCDLNGENEEEVEQGNHQFLHILDVLKNEHFGELYMFLNKPCPLSLRVKSKKVDLFLLRKKDATNIRKDYPNIWKRIDDKSMYNMKSIKALTKKVINGYCKMNGIIHEKDILERSDHLFACKDNESNEKKSQNVSSDNKNKKIKKKETANFYNKILLSPKRDKSKYNSVIFKKTKNIDTFPSPVNASSRKKKSQCKNTIIIKKSNIFKSAINNDIEDTPFDKRKIKRVKSSFDRKNKNILFSDNINKNSSLSFSQSDKSLNQKINKEKTIKKKNLELQKEVNDIKIIFRNPDNNVMHENTPKIPDTFENCHLSNIPINKTSNNNLEEIIEKNKTINLTNYLNNNSSQIQDIKNNKDSILPLIKTMSIMVNKNKLIKESTAKIEILASYNNINKMAKGKYINNKGIQKATQKFLNYYINSNEKKKEKLNDKKNENESVSNISNISSYNPFNSEDSNIDRKNSNLYNTNKISSDNKIKKYKFKTKILNKNSLLNLKSKLPSNTNVKFENRAKKSQSFKKPNKSNKLLKINKNLDNIFTKSQNSSNISVMSEIKNKLEVEKIILSNRNENISGNNENKELALSKNCYSEALISSSNSNSNFIQFGKNIISKKEDLCQLNKKLKEEKKRYNSSKNIINNKSNKNINEVNINFTNNFCKIF